ncbi:MAG: hypothetical protein KDJ19_13695 [Hyphomicrobiaceae bacterium]|nr:hypothetical protein [Hyphomicrobiaceae bacterium]MCC0024909.1 hypothetical protein [Hyphomicrobiaceae bacterium]
MIILEKLYNSAECHLGNSKPDWPAFAADVKQALGSELLFYHLAPVARVSGAQMPAPRWSERVTVIATSNPEAVSDYLSQDYQQEPPVAEDALAPLEPVLRTDFLSDDEFRALGPIADHQIRLGVFHNAMVPARLTDGSTIHLLLWRSEEEENYSERDRQRLALFMRYLLALVDTQFLAADAPDKAVLSFGQRHGLTGAETSILSDLLQGRSPRDIAHQSERSYGTVRWHIQNILEKCQVGSQKDLLREFYRLIHH